MTLAMTVELAATIFAEEQARLFAVAYRILGSVEEAEDTAQESWLRFQSVAAVGGSQSGAQVIANPPAWLTTVATRIALDKLRAAKTKRETYVGPWLPEPVPVDPFLERTVDPAERLVLAESLSIGFLSVLERLSAIERAVFVLREVFLVPMVEVADAVGKSEPATRQTAKRARDRVREQRPRFTPSPEDVEELTAAFMATLVSGDVDALANLLTEDVVVVSDGGANYRAARVPVVGRDRVGRFIHNLYRKHLTNLEADAIALHDLRISGQPCTYFTRQPPSGDVHEPYMLLVLNWSDGKLHSMATILNVDKLQKVHEHWLSAAPPA